MTDRSISRQIERELAGLERGRERYFRQADADRKAGREFDGPAGQNLIRVLMRACLDRVTALHGEAARDMARAASGGRGGLREGSLVWQPWILKVSPETASYVALRTILTATHGKMGWAKLSERVGRFCSLEDRWEQLRALEKERAAGEDPEPAYNRLGYLKAHVKRVDQKAVRIWLRKLDDLETVEWPKQAQRHVGVALLKAVLDSCPDWVEEREVRRIRYGRPVIERTLGLTREARKVLEDDQDAYADMVPWLEPMICPPRDWVFQETEDGSGRWDGGYWRLAKGQLFKAGLYRHTADNPTGQPVPELVLGAVNKIQRTAWRINEPVLRVLREAYSLGAPVLPVAPEAELPPEVAPADWEAMALEDRREIWDARRAVYNRNYKMASKRAVLQRQIALAADLAGEDAIWFPHNMDFRGRVYPLPQDLHPQADDVGRSLLYFAEAKRLGSEGLRWLIYQVASSYGWDKKPRDKQWSFAAEFMDELHLVAVDPLGAGLKFWSQAAEPWRFLAAALELEAAYAWVDGPTEYPSRLPVHVDGSCNGLQHLSAMGRDPVGAAATNLTDSQERADIYEIVAGKVNAQIEADFSPQADAWRGKVDRKVTKRGTMTIPYGLTRIGMRDQIIGDGWTDELEGSARENAGYLRDLMHDAIHSTVHGASDLMAWMQDNAYLLAKNGCPVSWVTPAGLVVTQAYWAPKSRVLRTLMGETRVRRSVRYAEPGSNKLQVRKQVSSIVPNVIHSFDAAHMMMTVVEAECSAFAVVHDSFGTHAADMPEFLKVIREQFVKIYSRDTAQDLQRDFEASRGTAEFPLVAPPAVGDFNISQVLRSPFFFA